MNADLIREYLGALLDQLSLAYEKIDVAGDDGFIRVDITSNQASKIIGWHGETLNSLQHLLKAMIRTAEKLERSPFIVLDVDGYRRSQEDRVCAMADKKADFVRRTNNRVALPPMSPYFRRVVHLHVANSPHLQDLTTSSTGEGEYRQIVLRLKDAKGEVADGEELSPQIEEPEGKSEDDLGNLDI